MKYKYLNTNYYSSFNRFISLILLLLVFLGFYFSVKINNFSQAATQQNFISFASQVYKQTNNISINENSLSWIKNIRPKAEYLVINTQENNKIVIQSKLFCISDIDLLKPHFKNVKTIDSQIINNHVYAFATIENSNLILLLQESIEFALFEECLRYIKNYKTDILIIGLIIAIFIYLLYESILSPFINISDSALAIYQGNCDLDIAPTLNQESNIISKTLQQMKFLIQREKNLSAELLTMQNKLSMSNLILEKKVSERTHLLERQLLEKNIFIEQLSHEIKNPLQGIHSISERVNAFWSEISEQKKIDFNKHIAYTSNTLLSLVSNLIDLSQISNGNLKLELGKLDLTSLIKDIIDECKRLYVFKKNINIHFNHHQACYVYADKERLGQVLRNLINNAIKYSPVNGSIAVSLSLSTVEINNRSIHTANVMIHDHGVGVNQEMMANIFNPLIKSIHNNQNSSKLGLTICYEIISAHQGQISADNNKDGGATFSFSIPINGPIQKDNSGEILSENLSYNKKNILAIDDEESCLASIEVIFYNRKNYNLIKSTSAVEALEFLKENYPYISAILVDLMMPDIYGLNLISEIKQIPGLKDIPIILQTSSSDENELLKALSIGAHCFIRKPYNKSQILEEVDNAIKYYEDAKLFSFESR
jgi:two-component system, sensor histidine kinase ChiS